MPEWAWRALWDLREAGDWDSIENLLWTLITNGSITEAEADGFLGQLERGGLAGETAETTLPPEAQAYLDGYTSKEDLAYRLASVVNQGFLTEAQAARLYNEMLGIIVDPDSYTPEEDQAQLDNKAAMLIRAALETVATEELEAPAVSAQIQALKDSYLPTLRTYLDDAVKAGSITQGQADAQYNYEESLIETGYDLKDLPNYQAVSGIIVNQPTLQETAMAKAAEQNRLAAEREQQAEAFRITQGVDAQKYLTALKIVVSNAVQAGVMTGQQAIATVNNEEALIGQGTPYRDLPNYEQVIAQLSSQPEPIEAAMAAAEETTQKQREQESVRSYGKTYLPRLKAYLDRAVQQGSMTGEQAQNIWVGEQALINQGIAPNSVYWQALTPENERENLRITTEAKLDEINRKAREARYAPGRLPEDELRIQGLPWLSQFMPQEAGKPMPSGREAVEQFLAGTYGEGTRLRNFIESEIPQMAEDLQAEREEWWRRVSAKREPSPYEGEEGETYEQAIERLRAESGRLGELLKGKGIAPTMGGAPTATGEAWAWQQGQNVINARLAELYGTPSAPSEEERIGRERLDKINARLTELLAPGRARTAGEQDEVTALQAEGNTVGGRLNALRVPTGQETYEKQMRGYFGAPARKEEDPLAKALRRKDFMTRYYRRPGTGLSPRLTPAIRFR